MKWTVKCYRVDLNDSIPSFKNSKKIVRIKGRSMLITDPKKQKKMQELTDKLGLSSLEFSGSLTGDVETLTELLQPYLTVLLEPESSKMTAWTSFKQKVLQALEDKGILWKS